MEWIKKLVNKTAKAPLPAQDGAGKPALKVSGYITEKTISFFPAGPSKRQVFGKLIGLLDLPDPNQALNAIMAREEAGTTVVAPGLALPHARISGITRLAAALGICPSGVVDPKSGAAPVKVYVLFLGPADNMKEHLAFLAAVSALFQKAGLLQSVVAETTAAGVLKILRDGENTF